MTFNRVKPLNWAFGEILTSSQMNPLDADHAAAVDSVGGGDCLLTAAIYFRGKGAGIGKVSGDDTPFSTANAKWFGAAADFGSGPSLALALRDICSFAEGKMLAVGGTDKVAVSLDDGHSWRDFSANIASPQTINMLCCAAKDFTILAGGGSNKVYTSVDASSFSNITLPAGAGTPGADRMHYHAGLDLFVVAGHTGTAPYLASVASSLIPTQRTVPAAITGAVSALSISQSRSGTNVGRMVATWQSQTKVAYSDDGTTWNASSSSLTSGSYMVASADGAWVALDAGASSNAYVSTDGATWATTGVTKPVSTALSAFTSLNGVLAAFDTNNLVWLSVDKGATWHSISLQYLGYNVVRSIRAVRGRLHALVSDGTNTVDMRSRRMGHSDGTV